MMSLLHLFWIVPLSVSAGVFIAGLLVAASKEVPAIDRPKVPEA